MLDLAIGLSTTLLKVLNAGNYMFMNMALLRKFELNKMFCKQALAFVLSSHPEQTTDETVLSNNIFANVAHLTFLKYAHCFHAI